MTKTTKILNATEFLKSRPDVLLRCRYIKGKGWQAILSIGLDGGFIAYEYGSDMLTAILAATDYAQGVKEPITRKAQ